MTLNEFEQLFKEVVEAYQNRELHYKYNRTWFLEGAPSQQYPCVLLDRMPKLKFVKGLKNNFMHQVARHEFKVFFFDTYHYKEQESKIFSQKQSDLFKIASQIFAEITRLDREKGHQMIFTYDGNFFGDIDMNGNELIELSCYCTAELKIDCELGEFNYEE